MAADRFLVDFHAEPGALRQLHVAVSGTNGLSEERRLVLAGRELHGRAPAPRRRHVERRGESRAEVEGMRRDGAIGGLGERAIFLNSVIPPTLVMLGCRMSAARRSTISRKPKRVDSFSPSAMGMSVSRASSARPA